MDRLRDEPGRRSDRDAMADDAPEPLIPAERRLWRCYEARVGQPSAARISDVPHVFFASPGKTGTTWLADVLRRHPDVFVPAEKELHFFDTGWREQALDAYLDVFASATQPCRVDATPYYRLSRRALRTIRSLRPDARWIVWLREPVAHAWSFLRHTCRWREAPFASAGCAIEHLDERALRAAALSDAVLTAVDPLGIVERVASVFPAERIHVGFLEDAAAEPAKTIDSLLAFLGVARDVDPAALGLETRSFVGDEVPIPPAFEHWLRELFSERARALDVWLQRERGRGAPGTWRATIDAPRASAPLLLEELDDGRCLWALDGRLHALDTGLREPDALARIRAGRSLSSAGTRHELLAALAERPRGPLSRWRARRRDAMRAEAREDARLEQLASEAASAWRTESEIVLVDVVGPYNLLRRTTRPASHSARWLRAARTEWIAVHHETGPMDLRFERVGDRSLRDTVVAAANETALRARVAELIAAREREAEAAPGQDCAEVEALAQ